MALPRILIKSEQIQQAVEEKIRSGEYAFGQRLPTEKELVLEFGCSLPTVNKAMAQLESRRLIERRSGKGTFISKNPDLGLVPVVFDYIHLQNPENSGFYNALMQALISEVRQHHYKAHFVLGRGKRGEEFTASLEPDSSLWKSSVGIIAMAGMDIFEDKMAEIGIPVLCLSSTGNERHALKLDYERLGQMAAACLVERGVSRVAVIGYASNSTWEGYVSTGHELTRRGIKTEQTMWFTGIQGRKAAQQVASSLLALAEFPAGLAVLDDTVAAALLEALAVAGRLPGRDFQIVAHKTDGVTPAYPEHVHTCGFSLVRLCKDAVRILGELTANPATLRQPSRHLLPPELYVAP